MVSQSEPAPAYYVMAMQRRTRPVNGMGVVEARESIRASIARAHDQVVLAKNWMPDCRLIVLPEFSLTGAPLMGESIAEWTEKAAIDPDGPEFDSISSIAQEAGVYLAGHAYESDRHFPKLFFAATWLISPTGERLLSYRRLHSSITPSPYDVWDTYLDVYGIDGVLSVAQTELGGISVIPCQEIVFPELSRALALRGCEVLLHPTSEVGGPLLKKHDVARRARAMENSMYVVSANSAGYADSLFGDSADGGSEIIDYLGNTMVKAGQGESLVANCEIDLAGLRRARNRANVENLLSRTKTGLWAEEYGRHDVARPNALVGSDGSQDASFYARQHRGSLDRLHESGVLK
jgi:predicted amidohydrolase